MYVYCIFCYETRGINCGVDVESSRHVNRRLSAKAREVWLVVLKGIQMLLQRGRGSEHLWTRLSREAFGAVSWLNALLCDRCSDERRSAHPVTSACCVTGAHCTAYEGTSRSAAAATCSSPTHRDSRQARHVARDRCGPLGYSPFVTASNSREIACVRKISIRLP